LILEKLGIYGFDAHQESCVFASLMSGEPLLFIGPPGVAKTELVKAIGSALRESSKRQHPNHPDKWFSYQIYDASKLNFEDLVGYPSIADLQKNPPEVKYVPTKSSIWGKDLIAFDEINRCSEDRQSNLFEIIRSRKLHGLPTGNTFIMSTMNPFGDQGTVEMSDALVDRHTFYLRLDTFDQMSSTDRRNVIRRVGDVDAVGLKYWSQTRSKYDTSDDSINDYLADVGDEIKQLMSLSQISYQELKDSLSDSVIKVIDYIVENLPNNFKKENEKIVDECRISGRRASSLFRAVLATRAVRLNLSSTGMAGKSISKTKPTFATTFINTINTCLPIGIGGNLDQNILDRAQSYITSFVTNSWSQVTSSTDFVDVDYVATALSLDNPIEILSAVLDLNLNKNTRNTLISKLLDKANYEKENAYREDGPYYMMGYVLEQISKELPDFIPPHINLPTASTSAIAQFKQDAISYEVPDKFIAALKPLYESYSHDPIMSMVIVACMDYYKNVLTGNSTIGQWSTDDGVKAIVKISNLCDKLSKTIYQYKEEMNAQDQDTEEETPLHKF